MFTNFVIAYFFHNQYEVSTIFERVSRDFGETIMADDQFK